MLVIAGIVLAAGRSQRMGRPKALLEIEGVSFLARAIATLKGGGCDDVIAVVPPDEPDLDAEASSAGARVARTRADRGEQIDSLRAGLGALGEDVEAAIVQPVDHPLVEARTVRALIAAFRARGAPIVVPAHNGEHGHPVLFSAAVFQELRTGGAPEGARSVVHAHEDELEEVAVPDHGVLADLDTPEAYRRHLGREP